MISTRTGLRVMQEAMNYRVLDKVFPFLAGFSKRSTGNERTATMKILQCATMRLLLM